MRTGRTIYYVLCLVALALMGCAEEEYPPGLWAAQHPDASAPAASSPNASTPDAGSQTASTPDASTSASQGSAFCAQSQAESLPARLVAMSTSVQPQANLVLVSDIFNRFNAVCGPCHTAASDFGQGGFQIVTDSDFPSLMTAAVIAHVTNSVCPNLPDSTNPHDPMPPCSSPTGGTYTARSEGDAVKQFAELVTEWLAAGSPRNSFTPPSTSTPAADAGDAGPPSRFVLSPQNGNAMTNIGNCVPSRAMVGVESDKSAALDAMFAGLQAMPSGTAPQMIGLPEHLGDTDLFTLDSAVLAQYNVLAYAPGYPLWSDNAGKLRHVRVPRGTSIHFDKTTQQFSIPPNTRFYKTFMKQIADTDGSYRYRKIETRLIVSRPDTNAADGSATQQNALFGTYRWTDDESDAVLVEAPLNSGRPFADWLFTYNTDEQLAADVEASQPSDLTQALIDAHAARHYAIPSSQRCIQCHMGSASQSFILGFTPLQINRRPQGVGGTIEATGPDELTQLQRFIDAGIITGIGSPADVLPLEQSQGSRTPRNNFELTAQGYALGNCTHCHNPRGYPTVQNPVLAGVLDFLPSATGGVFQFPLERYSPRIGRGVNGTTLIPYITPSLVDLPRIDPQTGIQAPDIFVGPTMYTLSDGRNTANWVFYAPWRSIIYRNVDSGFAYVDDLAIFPHMPFNSPGYDPRGKQILGDWMASIPAVRKQPEIVEYAYQTTGLATANIGSTVVDTEVQPYVELLPGAPGYDDALSAAAARLAILHTGANPAVPLAPGGATVSRYMDPGETDDILDPQVVIDPICHPVPTGGNLPGTQVLFPLPNHPHWVNTDLTDPPPPWAPRQSNWPEVLVQQQIPPIPSGCMPPAGAADAYADQVDAVGLLQNIALADLQAYSTKKEPFGLWVQTPGCNFSSQHPVSYYNGAAGAPPRPHWMDVTNPPADAPVYEQTPGAAVFKMICINCHGPIGDANGRLAQNLATMTGGLAQVANFRTGLFGPPGAAMGQRNMDMVYGTLPPGSWPDWVDTSVDDRAARYMAWMGLGGTTVNIPVALLEIVAVTKVLDQNRVISSTGLSANMLSQAKALCRDLLGPTSDEATSSEGDLFIPGVGHGYLDKPKQQSSPLIRRNYDAELWMRLCSLGNPSPIHVLLPGASGAHSLQITPIVDTNDTLAIDGQGGLAWGALSPASTYPAGSPIGNAGGGADPSFVPCTADNIDSCNTWPWCVDDTRADKKATADQENWIDANQIPRCPQQVKDASLTCLLGQTSAPVGTCFGNDAGNRWAVHGAVNAGMSVFLYVSSLEKLLTPPADYDQCEQLSSASN